MEESVIDGIFKILTRADTALEDLKTVLKTESEFKAKYGGGNKAKLEQAHQGKL